MGITAKSKPSKATENWGMGGFLLVFFPDNHHHQENRGPSSSPTATAPILESSSTAPSKLSLRRSNSTAAGAILGKTQSTLLVCALLLFASLLLFTLSTFEPALPTNPYSRRMLSRPRKSIRRDWFASETETALQGIGKLHLRGARAVPDLLVCHVPEDTPREDFRVFLRVLFRSGFTSRADVVILFAASGPSLRFEGIIMEESESFLKLLERYRVEEGRWKKVDGLLGFDVGRFVRSGRKEAKEPFWGKKVRAGGGVGGSKSNNDSAVFGNFTESTRPSYGSVVSFDASELDPEDSLAGFLDHVPIGLRRWACYPTLLGRVRRNYKHVVLAEAKGLLVLGDPFSGVRNLSGESVHVFRKPEGKPSNRNSDKASPRGQVNSAVLVGGARGVRRLSSSMLMEIVRAAMQQQQHRRKSPVTESGVLGQLVGNGHVLKNVNVVESLESIPELRSLEGLDSAPRDTRNYYNVIQRGNGNRELNSAVLKRICARDLDFSVYRDCQLAIAENI